MIGSGRHAGTHRTLVGNWPYVRSTLLPSLIEVENERVHPHSFGKYQLSSYYMLNTKIHQWTDKNHCLFQFSSVQSLSCVWLFATPWTAACQSIPVHHHLPEFTQTHGTFMMAQTVKRLSTMRETWVRFLGWEDPLEESMTTHSDVLAWESPWTEDLQSMGSQRVGHNWTTKYHLESPSMYIFGF